ncbi:MAG: hypothetical protein M5U25_09580 [Planctomycetota bacterium]|nr:hypothetical protein [Planctomycetota bacterium]
MDRRIESLVDLGRIRIEKDVDAWFEAIGRAFPQAHNRLAWNRVFQHAQRVVLQPGEVAANELEELLRGHRNEVLAWLTAAGALPATKVVWVGDMDDFGFSMSLTDFIEMYPVLMALPQHSYVVPRADLSWCLCYEMEGVLHFGVSAKSVG